MKLGSKNKDIDMFVDMLKSEGEGLYQTFDIISLYLVYGYCLFAACAETYIIVK